MFLESPDHCPKRTLNDLNWVCFKHPAQQEREHGGAEEAAASVHQLHKDAPNTEPGAHFQHVCAVFK